MTSTFVFNKMKDALLAMLDAYAPNRNDTVEREGSDALHSAVRSGMAALTLADPSKTVPMSPIYMRLSAALTAMRNCEKAGNTEWFDRWNESIEKMMRLAPSGGGFDAGTKLDMDKTNDHRLVFHTSYHHMSEHGYYNGWTEHTVVVTPDFGGFDMKISGRDRNDIKDYIADAFDTFLKTETND